MERAELSEVELVTVSSTKEEKGTVRRASTTGVALGRAHVRSHWGSSLGLGLPDWGTH